MDELKKDGLLPDEEGLAPDESAEEPFRTFGEADETDELMEELEGIRNMFQDELDKASEESNGMLIQELENEEIDCTDDEDEEIAPEDLCQCCEEKIRFKELDEDYPYCEDCRNAMKKYPMRKSGILAFLLSLAIFAGSLSLSYPYLSDAMTVADASSAYKSGYVMSALQSYYSYFNGAKTAEGISKRAFDEIIEGSRLRLRKENS